MIEWLAPIPVFLGVWALAQRKTWGWPMCMLGNIAWMIAYPGEGPILLTQVAFLCLNIHGWVKWKGKGKQT